MRKHDIFDETFESSWKEFDDEFRKRLLNKIQKLGSLHRLAGDDEEINTEYGRRFYEALEDTLASGKFVDQWKKALAVKMPQTWDELTEIFRIHAVYPLHAFYLLLIYIHEHPMRAFFSGRDAVLPFNTLTLKFTQRLSDPLPTDVSYELDLIRLERCPGLAYDTDRGSAPGTGASSEMLAKPHPQHHRWDLIWVWHFNTPPVFEPSI